MTFNKGNWNQEFTFCVFAVGTFMVGIEKNMKMFLLFDSFFCCWNFVLWCHFAVIILATGTTLTFYEKLINNRIRKMSRNESLKLENFHKFFTKDSHNEIEKERHRMLLFPFGFRLVVASFCMFLSFSSSIVFYLFHIIQYGKYRAITIVHHRMHNSTMRRIFKYLI